MCPDKIFHQTAFGLLTSSFSILPKLLRSGLFVLLAFQDSSKISCNFASVISLSSSL